MEGAEQPPHDAHVYAVRDEEANLQADEEKQAAPEVDGRLHWSGVKTHEARTVRLPRSVADELGGYLAGRPRDPEALVVFIAEVLRTHVDPATAEDPPLKTSSAAAGEPTPDPVPGGAGSRPGTLTVGPLCELERGHWACVSHRRILRTRGSLDRHTCLGEHRLVWLCWAHGPEQPGHRRPDHPGGDRQAPERTPLPLAKRSQRDHRRSA